jgi:MinD-like ATPase involved in chromosome partitioning or flagellar assembly
MEEPVTGTSSDVLTSPVVIAIARPDGTGEVLVDGVSHTVRAASIDAARQDCFGYVFHEVVQRLGRSIRVEARDSEATRILVLHPSGEVTADEDPSPPHPDLVALPAPAASAAPAVPVPPVPASPAPVPPAETPAAPVVAAPTASAPPATPAPTTWAPVDTSSAAPGAHAVRVPTLEDLLSGRAAPRPGPAISGWRAGLRTVTGGVIKLGPSPAELRLRSAVGAVQRSLDGPKTVVVINPKGGANKTTATVLIAAAFGTHRGGYTLAWDNNETRGTLGWRAQPTRHTNTAVDLLRDLDQFRDDGAGRIGDLDNYVRNQGSAQFDALASDEDAASAASIDGDAFTALHKTLQRFYRVLVVDTGNNMRASNWQAALEAADQLVIVSTIREDTSQGAAWAIDALRANGHEEAVANAVTILSAPAQKADAGLSTRLHRHFGALTRAVVDVPYDESLVQGGPIIHEQLAPATRTAWLYATAAIAEGF